MSKPARITCFDCGQINRIPADKLGAGPKCGTCGARLADGKVREVDLSTLQKAARSDDIPLVVDFWAPWCGPCRSMAPEFSKAAGALRDGARLVKLNTESYPKASLKYGIRGIPTVAIFKGGKEAGRKSGAMPAKAIESWIRAHG